MTYGELMQDPAYAAIISAVEAEISEADYQAKRRDTELTDANVRYVLTRALAIEPGQPATAEAKAGRKEAVQAELVGKIIEIRDAMIADMELSAEDWRGILEAVQEHFNKHSSHYPGERDYLDFIRRYIRKTTGG